MRAYCHVMLFLTVGLHSLGHRDVSGGYIYQHVGSSDPTTEGWIETAPHAPGSSGFSSGPITNDLGLGIDGWRFVDHSSLDGSFQFYTANLSSSQLNDANSGGWDIRAVLRVIDIPQTPSETLFTQFIDGAQEYTLAFGSQSNGDPIVTLASGGASPQPGTRVTDTGGGSGYHQYDLVYNPSTTSASLYIDGVDLYDGYTGFAASGSLFAWGSGDSKAQGAGIFSFVEFSAGSAPATVPEPASIALFFVGIACAGVWLIVKRSFRIHARLANASMI